MRDIEAELRAEAQAKRGKPYDPLARKLDWERIDAQAENDMFIAEMNRKAARPYRVFFDDETTPSETSFDRLAEGRSAT